MTKRNVYRPRKMPDPKHRQEPGQKIIKKLTEWRQRNHLSRLQVEALLTSAGCRVSKRTIEGWEQGRSRPDLYSAKVIEEFIDAHPTVTDAPKFQRWPEPLAAKKVTEIRRLRKQGMTLLAIAERLGVSESTVSRIARGERRKKMKNKDN
jgi:transcriptional regulator with XRE-family HTH domain